MGAEENKILEIQLHECTSNGTTIEDVDSLQKNRGAQGHKQQRKRATQPLTWCLCRPVYILKITPQSMVQLLSRLGHEKTDIIRNRHIPGIIHSR